MVGVIEMTELLDRALAVARDLPPDVQDDIAHVVLRLAGTDDERVLLMSDEQAAIDASGKAGLTTLLNLVHDLALPLSDALAGFFLTGGVRFRRSGDTRHSGRELFPDPDHLLNVLLRAANVLDDDDLAGEFALTPLGKNIASIEGWGVFLNTSTDCSEIMYDDDDKRSVFTDDDAAVAYVRETAGTSKLHRLALAIHNNQNKGDDYA
jgi:hypothetical protein